MKSILKLSLLTLVLPLAFLTLAVGCGGSDDGAKATATPGLKTSGGQIVINTAGPTQEPTPTSAPVVRTGDFASLCQKSSEKQFTAPAQIIDPTRKYTATVRTEKGDFTLELRPDIAPVTVNSFVFLSCKGFYDGVTFHRVLPDFVAQGGDPTGTGSGGPGYTIPDEFGSVPFEKGTLGMAKTAAPNSGTSQFYICYDITSAQQQALNGKYTVFGKVTAGMDVVEKLTPRDPQTNPNAPAGDKILEIVIQEQ